MLVLALSIAAAWLANRYVEAPTHEWSRRLLSTRA
jgi:peptidoglycan/LPS O-acetylase OafA/YrhL